jgi:probable rRNA maturation factor
LLHLAGYDHETDNGEMAKRERLLRGRLGLPQGLIERASRAGNRDQGTGIRKARLVAPAASGAKR